MQHPKNAPPDVCQPYVNKVYVQFLLIVLSEFDKV